MNSHPAAKERVRVSAAANARPQGSSINDAVTTPARSAALRFWHIFRLPSIRVIGSVLAQRGGHST